jgi:hypothetical protein
MPKGKQGQKRPADFNQLAKAVVDKATTGGDSPLSAKRAEAGRKGGLAKQANKARKGK